MTSAANCDDRHLAPDLSRGLMLLLIAMAYAPMYLPHADVGGYGARPGGGTFDQTASFFAALFLENRAFPVFAILFGAGMAMIVKRMQAKGVAYSEIRRFLRRRGWWLVVFGLIHAMVVFPGEILAAYGLSMLLLGWLLFRSDGAVARAIQILAPFTVAMAVAGSMLIVGEGSDASAIPGYTTTEDWVVRMIGAPIGPLFTILVFPLLILVSIGIWIGKTGLLDDPTNHRERLRRCAIIGIAISVLGAAPFAFAGAGLLTVGDTGFALLLALQIISGIGGGLGYVAAFGLLGLSLEQRKRGFGIVGRAIVAAGRRSLTTYLLVSSGVAIVLHPDLAGLGQHVHRAGAMGVGILIWASCVAFALLLALYGRPGPADALLRRLVKQGS